MTKSNGFYRAGIRILGGLFALGFASNAGWADSFVDPVFAGIFGAGCLPGLPCGGGSAPLPNLPGKWSQASYENRFGARAYDLYLPSHSAAAALPLVLALHGCTQDAASFAAQTGLAEIGEKYGFAVLFPEQTSKNNISSCWNWFKPENALRDSGELSIVVGMIGQVGAQVHLDPNRIYVTGLSAGGALTANLLACYSDLFAGGLIASGLEYAAAHTDGDAYSAMSSGSRTAPVASGDAAVKCTGGGAKLETLLIVHGTADHTVNPVNSTQILQQFTEMNDDLDDGRANGSQTTNALASQRLSVPNGYDYQIDSYGGAGGVHIVSVAVNGMAHAWSGAHQAASYADPKGPDAGEMLWQFLSQNSRRAARP